MYSNSGSLIHDLAEMSTVETEKPEAKLLSRLFESLNNAGVHYAVMRNYETLPHSAAGSDLDLLIDPQQEMDVMDCIGNALRDAQGVAIGHVRTAGLRKIFAFGKPDNPENPWWGLRIDICVGVVYRGSFNLLDESVWSEHVEDHNGINVLSQDMASVLGVLKEFLHNGHIGQRYMEHASEAVVEGWRSISTALSPLGGKALNNLRELCLGNIEGKRVRNHATRTRCGIEWSSLKAAPWSYLCNKTRYYGSRALRFLRPPGKMIALLGTDGSGKSTVIEAIKPSLMDATHKAMRIKHLRPGLLPPLGRIKDREHDATSKAANPHADPPSGYLLSLVRLAYYFLDYTMGYWLLVRPVIAKSPTLVLYDRYAHDIMLDPKRVRIKLPQWILRVFANLVPKPDLIICLHAAPEVLASRKQELPADEIKRQVNDLRAFAEKEKRAVPVNTEATLTESRNQVLESIFDLCAQRSAGHSGH